MKIKLIKSPTFSDARQFADQIKNHYLSHILVRTKRYQISKTTWEKIKTADKQQVVTVDTILVLLNDGCLLGDELMSFLELLQRDAGYRQKVMDLLENENYLSTWDDLQLRNESSESQQLMQEENIEFLQNQRAKAATVLKNLFHSSTKFFDLIYQHCFLLIAELQDDSLIRLLKSNPAAIMMLENDSLAKRISKSLSSSDIQEIILPEKITGSAAQLILLLKFLVTYLPRQLSELFLSIASQANSEYQRANHPVWSRLLPFKDDLIIFFDQHPEAFTCMLMDSAFLIDLFSDVSRCLSYISKLMRKDNKIAKWVGQNIILLVSALLRAQPSLSQEIVVFLSENTIYSTDGKKKLLLSFFAEEVKNQLARIEQGSLARADALIRVLENVKIRAVVKFSAAELSSLASQSNLKSLADRILTEDKQLWQMYFPQIFFKIPKGAAFDRQYPLIHRLSLFADQLTQDKIRSDWWKNQDAVVLYLITISAQWPRFKEMLLNITPQVRRTLPVIISTRLEYEANNYNETFSVYLVSRLITEENISCLLAGIEVQELFAQLASGEQYLTCLFQLEKLAPQSGNAQKYYNAINYLVTLALNSYTITIKILAALNEFNIISFLSLIIALDLVPQIDNEMLLTALKLEPLDNAIVAGSFIAKSTQLFEHLWFCDKHLVAELLIELLSHARLADALLLGQDEITYLKVINQSDVRVLRALFQSASCQHIRLKLSHILKQSLLKVTNPEFMEYFVSDTLLISAVTEEMTVEDFVSLLLSGVIIESEKINQELVQTLEYFPFGKLCQHKNFLLRVIVNNKFFAYHLLKQWPTFWRLNLLPEEILEGLFAAEANSTIDYLFQRANHYILAAFKNSLDALTKPVRTELLDKYPSMQSIDAPNLLMPLRSQVARRPLVYRDSYPNAISGLSTVNSLAQVHYKGLLGYRASTLIQTHRQLIEDFESGIEVLITNVRTDKIALKEELVPSIFMLCNPFYMALKELINDKPECVFLYVMSMGRIFYENIKFHFNNQNDIEQLGLVILLSRLKQLILQLVEYCRRSLTTGDRGNLFLSKLFLDVLYLATENYAGEVLLLLKDNLFFLLVCEHLYHQEEKKCQTEGELILRLLLLQTALNSPESVIHQENIPLILQELSCQPNGLLRDNLAIVVKLFPIMQIIALQNRQLTSYLLRYHNFAFVLDVANSIKMSGDDEGLCKCLLFYPHNYRRMSNEEVASSLAKLDPQFDAGSSIMASGLVKEHQYFKAPSPTAELDVYLTLDFWPRAFPVRRQLNDAQSFSNLLTNNSTISFLNTRQIQELITQLMANTLLTKFEIQENLISLVCEDPLVFDVGKKLDELRPLLGNQNNLLDEAKIEEWRQSIDVGKVASDLYSLMQMKLIGFISEASQQPALSQSL